MKQKIAKTKRVRATRPPQVSFREMFVREKKRAASLECEVVDLCHGVYGQKAMIDVLSRALDFASKRFAEVLEESRMSWQDAMAADGRYEKTAAELTNLEKKCGEMKAQIIEHRDAFVAIQATFHRGTWANNAMWVRADEIMKALGGA